jgi:hypothetical protein
VFYSAKLWCGGCGNGLVAFVIAVDGERLVLFCLQCGTWYPSIDHDANRKLLDWTVAEGPDLQLAGGDCSVKFPQARWATADEIRDFGWAEVMNPEPCCWLPETLESTAQWEERLRGDPSWKRK